MFNKWVVTITLSLSLLSGVTIGANNSDNDKLTSYTTKIEHNQGGGGRGVDSIDLVPPKTANNQCAVFNDAEIKYNMRRYGKATIIAQPPLHCDPQGEEACTLDISWKHAPAGKLNYNVKVDWLLQAC